MKILINDESQTHDDYVAIFMKAGYEKNELIFRSSYQDTKEFLSEHIAKKKLHIDLIITGNGSVQKHDELLRLRNFLHESYSDGNFTISSIPVILYSSVETRTLDTLGFCAVVQKNASGNHDYFITVVESTIRRWRQDLMEDLDKLGITPADLNYWTKSRKFKAYQNRIAAKADEYFTSKTKIVSRDFIIHPRPLAYDWFIKTTQAVEQPLYLFYNTLRTHKKYNRYNNERTVWHRLFLDNPSLIKRDTYNGHHYELNLNEAVKGKSKECDFILTTEFPELLPTNFLEVKREDKRYYVKKNAKIPQFSAPMMSDLKQLWGYKRYNENPGYSEERICKIGYPTTNFDYTLLAGCKEEKEEMQELFDQDLNDHFPGIQVCSFEDFGMINENYINKFNRLRIKTS